MHHRLANQLTKKLVNAGKQFLLNRSNGMHLSPQERNLGKKANTQNPRGKKALKTMTKSLNAKAASHTQPHNKQLEGVTGRTLRAPHVL